jgi:hypothetical protein
MKNKNKEIIVVRSDDESNSNDEDNGILVYYKNRLIYRLN